MTNLWIKFLITFCPFDISLGSIERMFFIKCFFCFTLKSQKIFRAFNKPQILRFIERKTVYLQKIWGNVFVLAHPFALTHGFR